MGFRTFLLKTTSRTIELVSQRIAERSSENDIAINKNEPPSVREAESNSNVDPENKDTQTMPKRARKTQTNNWLEEAKGRIEKLIEQREEEDVRKKREEVEKIITLPVWKKDERAIPSSIVRSALFGVVKRGKRKYLDGQVIACWKGVQIKYKGEQLDQADLDVYMELLNMNSRSRETVGSQLRFTGNEFLKALGRSKGGRYRQWLNKALSRLTANDTTIDIGRYEYHGSLIDSWCQDKETREYVVQLNKRIAPLFQDDYVRVGWNSRRQLSGDLEKWLHGYVCSHQATPLKPHKISLSKLKDMMGVSSSRPLRKFRSDIRPVMDRFLELGILFSWEIKDSGILEFCRPTKILPDVSNR